MIQQIQRKAKAVTLFRASVLVSSMAALGLAACATTTGSMTASGDRPQAGGTLAGTYLAANFAAAEGDVKGAAGYYANTLKDDPTNADILSRTFLFAAESGNIDQALALTDRVLAQDPQNRPAQLVRQMGGIASKNYAGVLKDITDAGPGGFTQLTSTLVQAWALAGMRDFDGALNALDSLAAQRGVDGMRLMHKALILDYAGRVQEADQAYHQAIVVMGTGARVADAFGRYLSRKGQFDEAKALYIKALADNPGHPVAMAALREVSSKRVPQPLISTPAEGVAEGLFGIAASLTDRRSADVAILYLNLTLYLRSDFDLARVLLASRYENMGRFEMANSIYARIAYNSPYYAMTQVQSAINDGRGGRTDSGIKTLRALASSQPKQADIWIALGDLLRSADRYQEAASAYDRAVAETPAGDRRLTGLYYSRGVSLERSNRWDDAERDFRAALKLNPDRADVLNYLGYSWVDKGEHLDEAVAMLEKARALRPLDGFIADSVGWAYYKLGRYQDAARTLEEAVQLAPGAADVNDHLGDAYWRVGRKIDARFQWQHALAMNPGVVLKPVIERKLQFGLEVAAVARP
jgi:tetratricopeptide (TPR) repeat protein